MRSACPNAHWLFCSRARAWIAPAAESLRTGILVAPMRADLSVRGEGQANLSPKDSWILLLHKRTRPAEQSWSTFASQWEIANLTSQQLFINFRTVRSDRLRCPCVFLVEGDREKNYKILKSEITHWSEQTLTCNMFWATGCPSQNKTVSGLEVRAQRPGAHRIQFQNVRPDAGYCLLFQCKHYWH